MSMTLNADVEIPGPDSGASASPGGGEGGLGLDSQDPGLIAYENGGWASNDHLASMVRTTVIPRLEAIRSRRVTLEDSWAEAWRLWLMHHDKQGYAGRSNLYIPATRKAMETVIAILSSSLFPTDDVIDVSAPQAAPPEIADAAVATKDALQHDLIDLAKMRQEAKVFLRQLVVTGTSPVKISWRNKYRRESSVASAPMVLMGKSIGRGGEFDQKVAEYVGPVWSTRDLLNWYIWPERARSVDDAEIVFEIMELSADTMRARARGGQYNKDAVQGALREAARVRPSPYDVELLARRGLSLPAEEMAEQRPKDEEGEPQTPVRIYEVYCNMVLPDGRDRGYQKDEPEPVLITCTEQYVLRLCPNPFPDRKPPYVVGRLNESLLMFYGNGFGALAVGLQRLVNDLANQSVDVAHYCLNPVVKRILTGVTGPLPQMKPGVVWNMLGKDDISFEKPPWELARAGIEGTQTIVSMLYDFLSAPPILQAQTPAGRGAKTARGMSILQQNSMTPLQDVVEDLEQFVFIPTLEKTAKLERQFKKILAPVETFTYRWLASKTAVNQQVRAQQIVHLLEIAAQFVPLLQQFGKTVDPQPLLERLVTEGFGMRGQGNFIVPMPMMPGMGMQPGGAPGGIGNIPKAPEGDAEGMERAMETSANNMANGNGGMGE